MNPKMMSRGYSVSKNSVLEVLLSAQINFNNYQQSNMFVETNPMYKIAKTQLDNALKAISNGKGLEDVYEDKPKRKEVNFKHKIKEGQEPVVCRGCGKHVYWIKTDKGKNMPINPDGITHFATCPQAGKFRSKK